ncbi:hypothetical protein [Glutamicibacter sp. NPDC127525]
MNKMEARAKAFEMILNNSPGGSTWVAMINAADTVAKFIIDGTVPEVKQ